MTLASHKQTYSLVAALVGREQPGDENLALRYVAAALERAGHRPFVVPLCGPDDIESAASKILNSGASLVGLSVSDADVAIDSLAFIRYLRLQGYRGHITCGGALATLGRHELLAKHPEIDSIIRHDGELPVVLLAERVAGGLPFHDLPAVTTREGDGSPSPVADRTALCIEPMHPDPLPRIMGLPVARLVASRGCPGRCSYCSPAALQRETVREGLAGGHSVGELNQAGVGGTRRRAPAHLADEIARLYHKQGARLLHMLDDNMLSGSSDAVEEWLSTLVVELRNREVGKIAISMQAEPGSLTPSVLDLLERLGVVRLAVGVEALTSEQLQALGRKGDVGDHRALLEELARRGMVAVFNSLLVHPSATTESIAAELSALSELRAIHYDAFAMAVYPGTLAHHRLAEEGRVTGGLLALHYRISNLVVSRFRAALIQMRVQGIRRYGVNVYAHDVGLNLALSRHFGLVGYSDSLQHELGDAMRLMNEVRIGAWRKALALACAELDAGDHQQAVYSLIAQVRRDLDPIWARLSQIQLHLEASHPGQPRRSNLLVYSALAAGMTLLFGTPACGGELERSASPYASGGAIQVDAGTSRGGTTSIDGGSPASVSGGTSATTGNCSAEDHALAQSEVTRLTKNACAQIADVYECPSVPVWGIVIDEKGHAKDVVLSGAGDPSTPSLTAQVRQCYLDALAPHTFPCLAGENAEIWAVCVICLF